MKRLFAFLVCAACLLAGCAGTPAESPSPSLTINGPSPSPDPSPELSPEPSPIVWDKSVFRPEEVVICPDNEEYSLPIYSDRQKMLLFGKTEPSVKVTHNMEDAIPAGGTGEDVWMDDKYIYGCAHLISDRPIYFEDGRKMTIRDALAGGFITGEDLVLNDFYLLFVRPINRG